MRCQFSDALSRPAAVVSTAGYDLPIEDMDNIDGCMMKEDLIGALHNHTDEEADEYASARLVLPLRRFLRIGPSEPPSRNSSPSRTDLTYLSLPWYRFRHQTLTKSTEVGERDCNVTRRNAISLPQHRTRATCALETARQMDCISLRVRFRGQKRLLGDDGMITSEEGNSFLIEPILCPIFGRRELSMNRNVDLLE